MKSNKLTKKLPYLIIFSVILFILTGCSNIKNTESNDKTIEQSQNNESENEENNPVLKALAAKIDE